MKVYNRSIWVDHVVDTVSGAVIQEGTPQSAKNFNNMEEGILGNDVAIAVIAQQVLQHQRTLADIEGVGGVVNLTNTQAYPFNNSSKTVSLTKPRDTLNYSVLIELVALKDNVGDIEVYDKQLNGFKIRYTGSAASIDVKYTVKGDMYQ